MYRNTFCWLATLPTHATVSSPVPDGVGEVNFVFVDFGVFFRDHGNANAILKLIRSPRKTSLELYRAKPRGGPPDEIALTDLEGRPVRSRLNLGEKLATVTLKPTAKGSSVFSITKVVCKDPELVFEEGGTVDFAGSTPGFDLGSRRVIKVQREPGATSHFPLTYVEAYVPPACEAAAATMTSPARPRRSR